MGEFRTLEPESKWLPDLNRVRRYRIADLRSSDASRDPQWQSVLDMALGPSPEVTDFSGALAIAEQFRTEHQDLTLSAMLAPLETENRDRVVELRRQVQNAVAAYQDQRFDDSIRILEPLHASVEAIGSEFDRLWIDLHRAEALIWTPDLVEAERLLDSVVRSARSNGFKWLLARSLTAYGGHPRLSSSPQEFTDRLREAINLYESIGVQADSSRARFYLATNLFVEGSATESFELANEGLWLTPTDARSRLFQHYWITSLNPLLNGSDLAFMYLSETAARAAVAGRPEGVASAHMKLAQLHEDSADREQADHHIGTAEDAVQGIGSEFVRKLTDINLRLAKAEILINRGQSPAAERLLLGGLNIIAEEGIDVFYEQQYRMELANGYLERGDTDSARTQFSLAVDAVERQDSTFSSQARLTFDEQRRDVYEAAIEFEFGRSEMEAARSYTGRYRTKLLTETVAQYASVDEGVAERVAGNREGPGDIGDGRVVEYTVLNDRILTWVRSRDAIVSRSYEISREDLQQKVGRFLSLMSNFEQSDELDAVSRDLYGLLIGPVADLVEGAESITFVPDRVLHRLPFAALRSPDGRYLVEDHVLTETLNVPYFLELEETTTHTPKLVSIGSQEQNSSIRLELARLKDIYGMISSFDGAEVNRALFLDAMSDASLFHYAGHSALDGTSALSSSILLDGNTEGPNSVAASEIANQRLATNALVVLASCDSSVGNSIGGVGYRGLTSAFLVAGAGSVVGSLWPVESTATTQLMLRFHRNLAIGVPIAEALRTAQVALLAERPHPYFWSGFTVTGNRSALQPAPFVSAGLASSP